MTSAYDTGHGGQRLPGAVLDQVVGRVPPCLSLPQVDLSRDAHTSPDTGRDLCSPPHVHASRQLSDGKTPLSMSIHLPTPATMAMTTKMTRTTTPPPRFPPAIIGSPATTAFPRNDGWYLAKQEPRTNKDKVRKLSDLTIHNITDYLTSFITQGVKPNCIANWTARIGAGIPFKKIFESFGTPLSDPTEERQWRKLVHRATFVRNRDPSLPDHKCRLCGLHEERILSLFQCQATAPLWRA